MNVQPPNNSGKTMCLVRWVAETPSGWVGAYDKAALEQMSITGGRNESNIGGFNR